jgi:hypothetical protein
MPTTDFRSFKPLTKSSGIPTNLDKFGLEEKELQE